jgi:hypothetical protein
MLFLKLVRQACSSSRLPAAQRILYLSKAKTIFSRKGTAKKIVEKLEIMNENRTIPVRKLKGLESVSVAEKTLNIIEKTLTATKKNKITLIRLDK